MTGVRTCALPFYVSVYGVCGYDTRRGEIFQLALNLDNNQKDVYMVGDNPIADILGAKALGIPAILVHRDVETNADYVCKTLLEVLEIIK